MSLSPGTRIGPYDILALVGAGGMGEVYRARDARLGRDVAVKVLPADVSADSDRLRRFEHEARAAAALNHPNILAVYDIGSSAQSTYIVTELLEGQTLRDLLTGERLPVSRAVDLAAQIASGLAAAHGRGIVHRDIKPENIFVTHDNHAKILDFGLATSVAADNKAAVEAPTRAASAPHSVLGTAGYMAPEQVRGQAVDHRADIFAFGAVVYEMLSGRRAFTGENALDAMSAILREPPATLASTSDRPIPPALVRLVERCLEKSPAARFQSTTDLAFALKAISQGDAIGTTAVGALPRITAASGRREWLAWGLVAVVSLALIGTLLAWRLRPAPALAPAILFTVPPPEAGSIGVGGGVAMAISPDGTQLVFGANSGAAPSRPSLWVRSLASIEARSLPAAANISTNASPFWSPSSRAVGFWSDGKLRRIDLDSGVVTVIGDTPPVSGPTWGPDGTIIFGSQLGAVSGGLYRISAAGGAPSPLTTPDAKRGEQQHSRPYFLPDGRHFVFLAVPRRICVGSLDSPEVKDILTADSQAVYSLGYLLFVRQATLLAQRFDPIRLETVGEPMVVAEDVRTSQRTAVAQFAASANGVLVYQTGDVSRNTPLAWLDRAGRVLSTVSDSTADYADLNLAPNARQAVVGLRGGPDVIDLWTMDLDRGSRLRLTSGTRRNFKPFVSPEGTRVVWSAERQQTLDLFWKRADGVGPDEAVMPSPQARVATDWSNQSIVFVTGTRSSARSSIWVAPVAHPADAKLYLEAKNGLRDARLSPDGRWMAYSSNESGVDQVYVQPFPDANGGRWLVSTADGGILPHWRADGQELIYLAPARRIMAVPLKFGPSVALGTPQVLFTAPGALGDATRDHTRFLMTVASTSSAQRSPLTVVVNWPSLLSRQ
jgi:hypothetical protein